MPCIDTIYTYSNYRKNAILKEFGKNFDKEIIMVGPYIQYADYFKSKDKLKALKSQLGKILLVFPTHSFEDCDDLYDFNQFSQCIDEMAKDYDTVLISMIGYDIQQGLIKSIGIKVIEQYHQVLVMILTFEQTKGFDGVGRYDYF